MTSPSNIGIVMRSLVEVVPTGDAFHEYFIVNSPLRRRAVTRRTAMDYIRDHGLVEALECEYGTIWDTPDRAFQRKYKGFVKSHYIDILHYWQ